MRVFACSIRVGVRVRLGFCYGLGFVQSLARGALGHCLDKLDVCKVLVGGGALRNVRLDLVRVIGLGLGLALGLGLEVRVRGGALRNVRLDLLGAQRGVRRLSHDVGLGQLPGALVGHAWPGLGLG